MPHVRMLAGNGSGMAQDMEKVRKSAGACEAFIKLPPDATVTSICVGGKVADGWVFEKNTREFIFVSSIAVLDTAPLFDSNIDLNIYQVLVSQ